MKSFLGFATIFLHTARKVQGEMMNKRKHDRKNCQLTMRIYTSLKPGAYSVDVTDIAVGGAFIKSRHLPIEGETISFEFIDSTTRPVYLGNASVVRLQHETKSTPSGFGIQFDKPVDKRLLDQLAQ